MVRECSTRPRANAIDSGYVHWAHLAAPRKPVNLLHRLSLRRYFQLLALLFIAVAGSELGLRALSDAGTTEPTSALQLEAFESDADGNELTSLEIVLNEMVIAVAPASATGAFVHSRLEDRRRLKPPRSAPTVSGRFVQWT